MTMFSPTKDDTDPSAQPAAKPLRTPPARSLAHSLGKGFLGGAACGVGFSGSSFAALVQITQVGNYLADNDDSNLNRNLTGNPTWGGDALAVGNSVQTSWVVVSNTGIGYGSAGIRFGEGAGFYAQAYAFGNIGTGNVILGVVDSLAPNSYIQANATDYFTVYFGSLPSVEGVVDVVFNDSSINAGPISGALHVTSSSFNGGSGLRYRVTIDALIFNDDFAPIDDLAAVKTAYDAGITEYVAGGGGAPGDGGGPVPEPSRVALLALGAAGVLARRQRPRRKPEAVAE